MSPSLSLAAVLAWPLALVLKATLLLATAGCVALLLERSGSAAARHLTWTLAVAALLLMPLVSLAVPQVPLGLVSVEAREQEGNREQPAGITGGSRAVPEGAAAEQPPVLAAAPERAA